MQNIHELLFKTIVALRTAMNRTVKKLSITLAVLLVVGLSLFVYIKYYYVFGEGVKAGELNYVVYKGVVFKTYEGKLIQSGIRTKTPGSLQSYEFEFSVEDKEVAERLMRESGKQVELHYKEYFGAIPWRGYTKFIVDSIITVGPESAVTPNIP